MDPVSYNPIKAKPKVNVTPHFGAKTLVSAEAVTEQESAEANAPPRPKAHSAMALSPWDLRFALGMVIVIILINTALVVLFSYDKAKGLTELVPAAGDDQGETVTLEELGTRPAKSSQEFSTKTSGTTTYITPERRQILLKPLNGNASEEIEEFEDEPTDKP